jgi:hypothetical protein
MVLRENGILAHFYLILAALILFILFYIYGFWYDHKTQIWGVGDRSNVSWVDTFRKVGVPDSKIKNLTHDDDTWYYNKMSTCVGYGEKEEPCPRHEAYCAGGKIMGDQVQQALEVASALSHGGQHPKCPLIHMGAD